MPRPESCWRTASKALITTDVRSTMHVPTPVRTCLSRGLAHMKILLIEDDQPTAAYVEKGLRQAGHEVDRSDNGHEGLVLATTVTYDAAVIDRMLPALDGLALVKNMRSEE